MVPWNKPLVKRDSQPKNEPSLVKRDAGMEEAGKHLAQSGLNQEQTYLLQDILKDQQIKSHLLESNIFIFGKVGFFDVIQNNLSQLVSKKKETVIPLVRNLADIRILKKKRWKKYSYNTPNTNFVDSCC